MAAAGALTPQKRVGIDWEHRQATLTAWHTKREAETPARVVLGFSLELRGATYEIKCYVSRVERGKPFSRHALMFFADNRLLGAGRAIENKIGKPAFLKDADIGPTFEQMGRKTVAQRMQRHRLLDAGRVAVS